MKAFSSWGMLLLMCALPLSARADLDKDQLKLLQDSGGWEYVKMGDADNGIQTEHICFDGTPHKEVCSGKLTLNSSGAFSQQVFIHGESTERHGTYKLEGDQLAFFDELGTRDGPYTIEINAGKKTMLMHMPQVRIELELESEYRKTPEEKEKK